MGNRIVGSSAAASTVKTSTARAWPIHVRDSFRRGLRASSSTAFGPA